MGDAGMQQAWREKMTLCFLIACMGAFVAFITIGLNSVLCPPEQANNQQNYASYNDTLESGKYKIIYCYFLFAQQ
jgi:chitin synthase